MVTVGSTKSFGAQGEDVWALKTDANGNVAGCSSGVTANEVTQASTSNTNAVPVSTSVPVGTHTVSVTNSNPTVLTSNANIVIQCSDTSANEPPLARRNFYTTNVDTQLIVPAPGVLVNDEDPDGDPLTASLTSSPSHGTVALNLNGSFTYDPDAGFVGQDSFTYRANDGQADSNVATVSITVGNVNDPPVADNQPVSTDQDTPVDITLTGHDDEDPLAALTFYIATLPLQGCLSDTDGDISTLRYTPNNAFTGTDSFTFIIRDTSGAISNTATVTITVGS